MAKGKVKWFDSAKGYGFIVQETGEDLFFHWSDIEVDGYKTIENNVDVEFDVIEGNDGREKAVRVIQV